LTWLSYFDPDQPYVKPTQPAPDGRRAPVRALLQALSVEEAPERLKLSESVISYRARSLGGVSLVAPENNVGLLAWAAVDNDEPQLFATLIDASGRKLRQKMLTRSPGEVTDVAAVRVEGGYLLAWVDGRLGTPEIFALKIDSTLTPVGQEHQVTRGAQAPAGVALQAMEGSVFLAWSDSRGASKNALADLYFARLGSADGVPLGSEKRLVETAGHAHAPQLRLLGGPTSPLRVIWVDSEPSDLAHGGHVLTALLDAQGNFVEQPRALGTPPHATDVSISCDAAFCRVVVLVSPSKESPLCQLWSARLAPEPDVAQMLLPLSTSRPEGVVPTLVGDLLYFADRPQGEEQWTLYRAKIDWSL
jgi:hypothetical protein